MTCSSGSFYDFRHNTVGIHTQKDYPEANPEPFWENILMNRDVEFEHLRQENRLLSAAEVVKEEPEQAI